MVAVAREHPGTRISFPVQRLTFEVPLLVNNTGIDRGIGAGYRTPPDLLNDIDRRSRSNYPAAATFYRYSIRSESSDTELLNPTDTSLKSHCPNAVTQCPWHTLCYIDRNFVTILLDAQGKTETRLQLYVDGKQGVSCLSLLAPCGAAARLQSVNRGEGRLTLRLRNHL